jgi:hypothetical protein
MRSWSSCRRLCAPLAVCIMILSAAAAQAQINPFRSSRQGPQPSSVREAAAYLSGMLDATKDEPRLASEAIE